MINTDMKVYIGSDHAGFRLKQAVKKWLKSYEDLGAFEYNKNDDYPVFAAKVGKKVAETNSRGILICGSGHGVCIAANKVKGIRAAAVNNTFDAKITRQHNDANVLCLSGWKMSNAKARNIINVFLKTKFTNAARHKRRINLINKIFG